jgi:hypothetical protein
MGEYIEQPGKLLAWTLLGVALWEAGRPGVAGPVEYHWPSRRSLAAVVEPAVGALRSLPRPALGLIVAVGLAVVAVPVVVRALSESEYVSRTEPLLAPPGQRATWQLRIGRLLGDPSFQQGIALDSARNVDVRQVSAMFGDRDGQLTFSVTATGSTPRQAKRLAQVTGRGLLESTYFVSMGQQRIERTRLRERLEENPAPGERAAARKRVRNIDGGLQLTRLYLSDPVAVSEPPPGPLVDRVANDLAGRLAPPPTAAWAGLAGLVCALLLGVAALVSGPRYGSLGR